MAVPVPVPERSPTPMPKPPSPLATCALLAVVALLAWLPREVGNTRIPIPGEDRWVTMDADSMYHMRQVWRALDRGFGDLAEDPYLDWPHGARVPWPPYYTLALARLVAPGLPAEPRARRAAIEERVASVPLALGVVTALVVALSAMVLAGRGAALVAGTYFAFCFGSIAYSRGGNGDHHAWVSMLGALTWLVLSAGFARGALDERGKGTAFGTAAGVLAGILVGSWVAALLHVLCVQLVLGGLLFANARRERRGLAAFGLAFHLAALVVLLPAVLASAWKEEFPWMVVNLSWFHLAELALGALVFVPLFFLRPSAPAFRAWPWTVAAALAVLFFGLVGLGIGPGAGISAGFDWVGRADAFMSTITESLPLLGLLGSGTRGPGPLFDHLGYGVVAFPAAWGAMALALRRAGEARLLPWLACGAVFAWQAASQRRFADAFAGPLAVALAWGWSRARSGGRPAVLRRVPLAAWTALGVLLALASHAAPVVVPTVRQALSREPRVLGRSQTRALSMRWIAEWLRDHSPPAVDYGVLANWGYGHLIEWAADRPTVSTNFGSYIGEASFVDSARFLLEADVHRAEALLRERRVRYVVLSSEWPIFVGGNLRSAWPERWDELVDAPFGKRGALKDAWFDTLGARLMFDGGRHAPGSEPPATLDFLRVVHVSPITDPEPPLRGAVETSPAGWVWERVEGARLEARGAPGEELSVELRVRFERARHELLFRARAACAADGVARLRVPYATTAPGGDGRVLGRPLWRLGGREGTLVVDERDVLEGRAVRLL